MFYTIEFLLYYDQVGNENNLSSLFMRLSSNAMFIYGYKVLTPTSVPRVRKCLYVDSL